MPSSDPTLVVNVSLDRLGPRLRRARHLPRPRRSGSSAWAPAATSTPRRSWSGSGPPTPPRSRSPASARPGPPGCTTASSTPIERVKRATTAVPVTDGHALRDVLQEWAIRHVQTEMPGYFANARTVVLGGLEPRPDHADPPGVHRRTSSSPTRCCGSTCRPRLHANPLLGLAADVGPLAADAAAPAAVPSRCADQGARRPGSAHALARKAARDCDVVVATYDELAGFGLEDLAGKTLVTSAISDDRLAELAGRGVDMVLDATPSRSPRHRHGRRARGDDAGPGVRPRARSPTTTCST